MLVMVSMLLLAPPGATFASGDSGYLDTYSEWDVIIHTEDRTEFGTYPVQGYGSTTGEIMVDANALTATLRHRVSRKKPNFVSLGDYARGHGVRAEFVNGKIVVTHDEVVLDEQRKAMTEFLKTARIVRNVMYVNTQEDPWRRCNLPTALEYINERSSITRLVPISMLAKYAKVAVVAERPCDLKGKATMVINMQCSSDNDKTTFCWKTADISLIDDGEKVFEDVSVLVMNGQQWTDSKDAAKIFEGYLTGRA